MEIMPKKFWEDQKWGFEHHSELINKYKDLWVAIVNKKIVSSGNDLAKVEIEAKQKTGKKHVPVMYVECGSHIY